MQLCLHAGLVVSSNYKRSSINFKKTEQNNGVISVCTVDILFFCLKFADLLRFHCLLSTLAAKLELLARMSMFLHFFS